MVGLCVIGVDVGGTNTDAVIVCGKDVVAAAKRPTEENRTNGIVKAIRAALDSLADGVSRDNVVKNVARVCIGTTHFVNAVTSCSQDDRKGLAQVAVIRLCGSASLALPPFCDFPEHLRQILCGGVYMVSGGFQYNLEPIKQLDQKKLEGVAEEIRSANPAVRNVVISGVFSPHDDPENNQEQIAASIIQAKYPDLSCTLSHKVGLLGLIERENAAILNECLKPLAQETISSFRRSLDDLGLKCAFYLTQNDGTLISAEEAMQFPVLTFSSGPTNSMRGAVFLSGLQEAIVIDIGGTTTDVGVVKRGFPREATSQSKVGGVRTNFSIPDVLSIALGGGSRCQWNAATHSLELGESVGHKLITEALCFGGDTCTATDVAVAAGVAPRSICLAQGSLDSLHPTLVYMAMSKIRTTIERAIDCVKMEKVNVPVVLVGGGSCLVDKSIGLQGASSLVIPENHWDVANAVGAALSTVGSTVDIIEEITVSEGPPKETQKEREERIKNARLEVLEKARGRARTEVISKGAIPSEVFIHSEDVMDMAYFAQRVRVRVKAIGPLRDSLGPAEVVMAVEDNPHWPFHSEEHKQRDQAALLPTPRVEAGEWWLSAFDVECVALGAGLLGSGGGGDPNLGRIMALKKLQQGKQIKVVNPARLDSSTVGLITCVAFMGAPAIINEKLVGGGESACVLEAMQRVVLSGVCGKEGKEGTKGNERLRVSKMDLGGGKQAWVANTEDLARIDVSDPSAISLLQRITHLLCAEAGGSNSMEPLVLGAEKGMPVLDADGMGRAFPELQMYVPFIYGCKPYPSCVADDKGSVMACTHVSGAKELEDFFRAECVKKGMSVGVSIGVLTLQDVNKAVMFSISLAWQLGRTVEWARKIHSNVLQAIASQQNGKILLVGKVTEVVRVNRGGFGHVEAVVEGLDRHRGHLVRVLAKNENYLVRYLEIDGDELTDGAVLACTPDIICVVDSDTGYPITTEVIRYGMRVGVLALPANPRLLTPHAMSVVGPAAFGYPDVDYHSPQSLEDIGKILAEET